jgi:glycosyl transferase family 25
MMAKDLLTDETALPTAAGLDVRVIHLERAAARRTLMAVECDRVGLCPSVWAAVDASDPTTADRLASLPDQGPWGPMHAHAKGCLLSHLDALQGFLASGASHVLILEDDVFLADDLSRWTVSLDWWPPDADVVKIERWRDDRLLVLLDRDTRHHAGRRLQRMHSRHAGTGGYMITRAAATRLVAQTRRDLPVDHLLFNPLVSPFARDLLSYQVSPALVVQGNEPAPVHTTAVAKPPRPLKLILRRGLAELRAVAALPLLLSRRATLTRIGWQSRVPLA